MRKITDLSNGSPGAWQAYGDFQSGRRPKPLSNAKLFHGQNSSADNLLSLLKEEQKKLSDANGKYLPITLKIVPDLSDEQIAQIAHLLMHHYIGGIIATDTTLSRDGVENLEHGAEAGWLPPSEVVLV